MTYFGRLTKAEAMTPLPAGKTMDDYTDQPNKGRVAFHALLAGFHRRQSGAVASKDDASSKYHMLAAHAHEAAKFEHAEALPSAEVASKAANSASDRALSEDARGKPKAKKP